MADWLAAYVLPYNSKTLADVMLCAERIGGIRGSMVASEIVGLPTILTKANVVAIIRKGWPSTYGTWKFFWYLF